MLALTQSVDLFSKSPYLLREIADDDNNNITNSTSPLSCGAMALKMLSGSSGPRRCLFGSPSTEDTQRLLQEDLEAARARMLRRWGWDPAKEAATGTTNWQWESIKVPTTSTPASQTRVVPRRHHPYPVKQRASDECPSPFPPVPAMVSPLPDTPRLTTASPASTSSSSGTSTLPASPSASTSILEESSSSMPSDRSSSEDSCCGGSETGSDGEVPSRSSPAFVQTRLTDFWRTRRSSGSEVVKTPSPQSSAPSKGSAPQTSAPVCPV